MAQIALKYSLSLATDHTDLRAAMQEHPICAHQSGSQQQHCYVCILVQAASWGELEYLSPAWLIARSCLRLGSSANCSDSHLKQTSGQLSTSAQNFDPLKDYWGWAGAWHWAGSESAPSVYGAHIVSLTEKRVSGAEQPSSWAAWMTCPAGDMGCKACLVVHL